MGDSTDIGTASSLPIHVEIPGYRLRYASDTDAIGIWFSAEQEKLGRRVTLKVLKPKYEEHPQARREFLSEMDRLARLDHPSLPHVLDTIREGYLVLVVERIGSKGLNQQLAEDRKPMAEGRAIGVALGVARGLLYLQQQGLAHKNVCPRTIILRDEGDCRLVTFRYIITTEEFAALKGKLAQDPQYAAPEQIGGPDPVGPTAPSWQVGALLFHLLAGRPPRSGSNPQEVAKAQFTEPFPSLKRFQPFMRQGIHDLIAACTQRDPATRPGLAEVVAGLEALGEGRDAGLKPAPPESGGVIAPKSRRRRRRR